MAIFCYDLRSRRATPYANHSLLVLDNCVNQKLTRRFTGRMHETAEWLLLGILGQDYKGIMRSPDYRDKPC